MLSTAKKVFIARILSLAIISGRRLFLGGHQVEVTRGGIRWSLDLTEGIDLAIYLLGGFEVRTLNAYKKLICPGDIVLDIGANIGAHTLPLARLVGNRGKVYSFEPTQFAFNKQLINVAMNKDLITRIQSHQMMLVSGGMSDELPDAIHSSWPLEDAADLDGGHRGRLMSTKGSVAITLDNFIEKNNINKISLIKLDVDGNELDVLRGGINAIREHKPKIIIELAPYTFSKNPEKFEQMINLLMQNGYRLFNVNNMRELPQDIFSLYECIPKAGGINALAMASTF